ncbi:D-alanyl-D-alanine carboxypeptidase [Fervidicella metallireducens AeB]|uniref:serine-type D-Ala-D-Ala carboxypeptidase n=1 Tax=Fervidicella metallireducens AeB TaxID=1403537 RepID=A0A017RV27_9CLOT|nr:D-alanyl-D-alanine carboxypeptidase family protein [Fervidicella metallireducens]EYE87765.1 D-alanyl-D-alanine carboxypeptidase [Fervidicella metallireducens AeB]
MKRCFVIILSFFILFSGIAYASKGSNVNLKCVSGVVIDQNSGRVLYSKNGNKILPMASTTKIITAIVALERGNINDVVIVSGKAASVSGSQAGLKAGEKVKLEELLYGLMLRSGNDAAVAIAEHIAGSTEDFAKLMNDKAMELGAYSTSFITPHGLDAENHFTTAEDLARITAYAMKNEFFAKISSTKEISSGVTGKFNRSYSNINKFLYRIENSDGVKTGFTGKAGKCLVASVKHNYGRYICVVLNSDDRWKDAEKLIRYAEDNYKFVKIMDKGEPIKRFRVYGGNERYVLGNVESDLYLPLLPSEYNSFKTDIYAPSVLFSPTRKGEVIGNIVVELDDKIIAKYHIYSDRTVKRKNFMELLRDIMIK